MGKAAPLGRQLLPHCRWLRLHSCDYVFNAAPVKVTMSSTWCVLTLPRARLTPSGVAATPGTPPTVVAFERRGALRSGSEPPFQVSAPCQAPLKLSLSRTCPRQRRRGPGSDARPARAGGSRQLPWLLWNSAPKSSWSSGSCLPWAVGPRPFKIWGPPLISSLYGLSLRLKGEKKSWDRAGGGALFCSLLSGADKRGRGEPLVHRANTAA